jgi:glycosyltransferase involved in cell wall biosynthesis
MRVIQVLAGAVHGGAETAFEDIAVALSAAGIQQKIIVRGNNKARIQKFKDAGIDVVTLPFGGVLDIYTPWKIKKIIADFHPQIVQTWMSRATSKTPASSVPKSYVKIARLGGYYDLKYFKGTDEYVAITPHIREYLIREGIDAEHTHVVNNFADAEQVITPVLRADLNTPEQAPVILALSRYHTVKALDVLIKATAQIAHAHLWLAGEGPQEQELKDLASTLGMTDRVHFLGWRRDRAALLQAADICVFPSRYEPFGTVFVQAWAQHTPLICSKAQGPVQYVHDGEDGLMFDIDDVGQLTQHLQTLINDQDLAKRLADAGYIRYQNEFTREKIVETYINLYRRVIQSADLGADDK